MNGFDISIVAKSWPYLWSGLEFSLLLTATAFTFGMVIGTSFAIIQHAQIPVLAKVVKGYVTMIRSVPLIMVLFWFFFLVPIVIGHLFGHGRPVPIGATYTAVTTFSLFEAAYYSEILRFGFRAISKGQYEGAQALSLSGWHTYRYVILPQVFRSSMPIILTQTITLFQDTSLVYVLSLTDLLGAASKIAEIDGHYVEMYTFVAVIYLLLSFSASQAVSLFKHIPDR